MFIFKQPPTLPRTFSRSIIRVTETLGSPSSSPSAASTAAANNHDDENARGVVNKDADAIVLDARAATTTADLTWLYHAAKKHANTNAFRAPGGRVVVLRTCPDQLLLLSRQKQNQNQKFTPQAVAVSEAIVGFTKSLAKENGSRGATVNLLCDATGITPTATNTTTNHITTDAVEAPLQWLLSNQSCYVTGQELSVSGQPNYSHATPSTNTSKPEVVLITGAAGAIGKSTAEFLCNNNNNSPDASKPPPSLLILDHPSTEAKLQQIAKELADTTGDANQIIETLPLDITQDNAGSIIAERGAQMGGFNRVLHAAGITRDKTLRNMDLEASWLPVLQVNLEATMNIDQALLSTPGALVVSHDGDEEEGYSGFVYISSISGISGNAGQSNYAASKAALLGYAQAMSQQYDSNKYGFRVVSPGFIQTDMTQKMPFLVRIIASRLNAMGQAGQPEDVAAAIAFLSSPEAAGLTPGLNLRVCASFMGGR